MSENQPPPDYHTRPMLAWRPSQFHETWLRNTAERRNIKVAALLAEIMDEHINRHDPKALKGNPR